MSDRYDPSSLGLRLWLARHALWLCPRLSAAASKSCSYSRALPPTNQQRAILAGNLNDYVRANFPEHAESHSGAGIRGVPGFWQELSGVVHIWKPRNYLMPLLVIPYKDANGLI